MGQIGKAVAAELSTALKVIQVSKLPMTGDDIYFVMK